MLFRTENITKSYKGDTTIEDISISVSRGERAALIGQSGVGKSTLFNIVAGILPPDSGRIFLENEDITSSPGKIGYMLQNDLLMPYKTVLQNVSLPLLLKGNKKKEAEEKAAQYFSLFGLEGCEKWYPHTLSGGMRRRAALLRTYLTNSPFILLDEPFSALDSLTREEIWRWFIEVGEKVGISTLFITHDILEAQKYADRIFVMAGKPGVITNIIEEPRKSDAEEIRRLLV